MKSHTSGGRTAAAARSTSPTSSGAAAARPLSPEAMLPCLLELHRLVQRLDVGTAEGARPLPFDDLEEQRALGVRGGGEYLEQLSAMVLVGEQMGLAQQVQPVGLQLDAV